MVIVLQELSAEIQSVVESHAKKAFTGSSRSRAFLHSIAEYYNGRAGFPVIKSILTTEINVGHSAERLIATNPTGETRVFGVWLAAASFAALAIGSALNFIPAITLASGGIATGITTAALATAKIKRHERISSRKKADSSISDRLWKLEFEKAAPKVHRILWKLGMIENGNQTADDR